LHAVHKTIVADLDMQTSIVGVSETSKWTRNYHQASTGIGGMFIQQ
jgi:hypothetical protein